MPDNRKELMNYRLESAKEQYGKAEEFLTVIENYLISQNKE
nr:hypothetical protein [uncultured Marvinbryantia sp.]